MTVMDYILLLDGKLGEHALKNAFESELYKVNCVTHVNSLQEAIRCAFNPATTPEGLVFWCKVYDELQPGVVKVIPACKESTKSNVVLSVV